MTDYEVLQRANMYIKKMAQGINPLTDEPVDDEDLINNVRISRCLFYVSEVLENVINGSYSYKKNVEKKSPFYVEEKDLEHFNYSETPIALSVIAEKLNELIDTTKRKKITYKVLAQWLIKNGYLVEKLNSEGDPKKSPTEKGKSVGITTIQKISQSGDTYEVVVYNLSAQKMVVSSLKDILVPA